MIYRKEIDGLRAFAVVPVVLFHAGLPGFSGGYAGVDIFFVISGFLITTIIMEDIEKNRFSITHFYERRARRILPALAAVVGCTTVAAVFLLQPDRLREYGEEMIATAFFGANIYFWRTTDYFGTAAEERPLLHMWSLAVEEQFYIVFPLVLLALWRMRHYQSRSLLLSIFLVCAIASFALSVFASYVQPIANFYLPVTRAWELLAGSIIALRLRGEPPAKTRDGPWLAGVGLILVMIAVLWIDDTTPWPGPLTLLPVVGTCLILAHARDGCLIGRILGLKPIVWIGLLSYSIYLWHQPLFAFARIAESGDPEPLLMLILALATVALAWCSWWFVERPFRKPHRRGGFTQKTIFSASLACISAIALIGVLPSVAPQFTERLYTAQLSDEAREQYFMQKEATKTHSFKSVGGAEDELCRQRFPTVTSQAKDVFLRCTSGGQRAVIVTGGSHGIDLYHALAAASDAEIIFGFARGYCRPHKRLKGAVPHECPFDGLSKLVAAYPDRISLVVYTQTGVSFFGAYRDVRSAEGLRRDLVAEVAEFLVGMEQFVHVIALGPKPMLGIDPRHLAVEKPFEAQIAEAQDPGIQQALNAVDRAFEDALEGSGVHYLLHSAAIGTKLPEEAILDGVLTYRDRDHWSRYGAKVFGERLVAALRGIGYAAYFPIRPDYVAGSVVTE